MLAAAAVSQESKAKITKTVLLISAAAITIRAVGIALATPLVNLAFPLLSVDCLELPLTTLNASHGVVVVSFFNSTESFIRSSKRHGGGCFF